MRLDMNYGFRGDYLRYYCRLLERNKGYLVFAYYNMIQIEQFGNMNPLNPYHHLTTRVHASIIKF